MKGMLIYLLDIPSCGIFGGIAELNHSSGDESGLSEAPLLQASSSTGNTRSTAKVRKKKKRKSRKPAAASTVTDADEIDEALVSLESLSVSNRFDASRPMSLLDPSVKQRCAVLAIDTQHLQVGNEMRRLFGKAAFEAEQDENAQARSRRPHNEGDQFGLAEAVAGRNSHAGAGLPQMIRRRNVFVQGKEEWPKASGGGLGMDIVETDASGIVEYTFVHNKQYQSAQQEFDTCVLTMDPNLMVNLLRFVRMLFFATPRSMNINSCHLKHITLRCCYKCQK